jgi:hypothetical protein
MISKVEVPIHVELKFWSEACSQPSSVTKGCSWIPVDKCLFTNMDVPQHLSHAHLFSATLLGHKWLRWQTVSLLLLYNLHYNQHALCPRDNLYVFKQKQYISWKLCLKFYLLVVLMLLLKKSWPVPKKNSKIMMGCSHHISLGGMVHRSELWLEVTWMWSCIDDKHFLLIIVPWALSFLCYSNILPQTGWRETIEIYSLTVLRARNPKSRCQQGNALSGGSGKRISFIFHS